MIRAALAGLALMLPGCQTIKVQGVEIDRETQFVAAAFAVAGALVIAHLADGDDEQEKCTQYVSVPPGKDAPFMCEDEW